jgi:hypothetical protein
MTVRGGGVPRKPWLSCRCAEWARRLGAFAADAQDCIMVRVVTAHRIQGCGTNVRARQASSPLIVIPTAPSVPSCSKLSRCGLARAEYAARLGRRPTLTAPARAGFAILRVGAKKRAFKSNKEIGLKEKIACREFFGRRHARCQPRAPAAGVRKAPRHEIAVGWARRVPLNLDFSNSISLWRRMKPATAIFSGNKGEFDRVGALWFLRFADCESGGVRLPAMRVLVRARRRSERRNGTWFSPGRAAQEELKARRRYR